MHMETGIQGGHARQQELAVAPMTPPSRETASQNRETSPGCLPEYQAEIAPLWKRLQDRLFPLRFPLDALERSPYPRHLMEDLVKLLNRGEACHWQERAVAAWMLGVAPLTAEQKRQAVQVLTEVLGQKQNTRREVLQFRMSEALSRSLGISLPVSGTLVLCNFCFFALSALYNAAAWDRLNVRQLIAGISGVTCMLLVALLVGIFMTLLGGLGLGMILYPLVLPLSVACDEQRNTEVRRHAAIALGRLGMPESVGALATAYREGAEGLRQAAKSALASTLPHLTEDHYGQFSAETTPCLCEIVQENGAGALPDGPQERFALAILEALGKIGDGRALPTAQAIAEEGATPRLRKYAAALLPVLEARRQKERDRGMLLRGAERPPLVATELLRPTEKAAQTGAGDLLRPTGRTLLDETTTGFLHVTENGAT